LGFIYGIASSRFLQALIIGKIYISIGAIIIGACETFLQFYEVRNELRTDLNKSEFRRKSQSWYFNLEMPVSRFI